MCGRGDVHHSDEELRRHLDLHDERDSEAPANDVVKTNYNLAPTDAIPVVRRKEKLTPTDPVPVLRKLGTLETMRWGLTMPNPKHAGVNARMESLGWNVYRDNLRERRCLIVLSSFYEWKKVSGKAYPHRIVRDDGAPLVLAGLYDTTGGCAIITKPSLGALMEIHERMPVMLERRQWEEWLDPRLGDAMPILSAANAEGVTSYPVSARVSSVKSNDATLIERVSVSEATTEPQREKRQLGLF